MRKGKSLNFLYLYIYLANSLFKELNLSESRESAYNLLSIIYNTSNQVPKDFLPQIRLLNFGIEEEVEVGSNIDIVDAA